MDPLVPNQVRYQTAPHSDKSQIIDRTAWVLFANAENLAFRVLCLAKQDVPSGIVRQWLSQVCQHLHAALHGRALANQVNQA